MKHLLLLSILFGNCQAMEPTTPTSPRSLSVQYLKEHLEKYPRAVNTPFAFINEVSPSLSPTPEIHHLGDEQTPKVLAKTMDLEKPAFAQGNISMTKEDFDQCQMIMQIYQEYVQGQLLKIGDAVGKQTKGILQDMDLWVEAYTRNPIALVLFAERASNEVHKEGFSFAADPTVVEELVNIKNASELRKVLADTLKSTGGKVVSHDSSQKDFNYFGILNAFTEANIETRLIKFHMDLKETKTTVLCTTTETTKLNAVYDTYMFSGSSIFIKEMAKRALPKLLEAKAKDLEDYILKFYEDKNKDYEEYMKNRIKNGSQGDKK